MALHQSKRGLELPLAGAPAAVLEAARAVTRVALLGADAVGLKPGMRVAVGDAVRRGQPLFEDKARPGLLYTAPAAGRVAAIHRGERRAFVSLVIDIGAEDAGESAQVEFASWRGVPPGRLDAAAVRALLLESGLWAGLRQRPFGVVPPVDATPGPVFVTAIDTRPHAPPMNVILAGRDEDLRAGLSGLLALGAAPVLLCVPAGLAPAVPDGVRVEQFAGPHPAGNVGWHLHVLRPVDAAHPAWHLGVQDLLALGHLLRTGRLDLARVVALGGPAVRQPRLLRTRLGASVDQLTDGELDTAQPLRVISGSVLDGRRAMGEAEGYLGRFHQQVAALHEGAERRMFGYIAPAADRYSVTGTVLGAFTRAARALTTTTNGGLRALVPIGTYERVLPFDLLPTYLLRALLTKDDVQAEALGALELDEEDIALATCVCPSKIDYGPLLRGTLDRIAKEHA